MIKSVYWSSCKNPPFLYDFNETCIFQQIFKKYYTIKFHQIRPVEAELFQVDRHNKIIVTFSNSANASKEKAPKCLTSISTDSLEF